MPISWLDIQGTPLIETIPAAPDHLLVTFLWQAHEPIDHVVLISPLGNGWWKNFTESTLVRLRDTNLYYRTYQVRSDARFLYQLSPNDALSIRPMSPTGPRAAQPGSQTH